MLFKGGEGGAVWVKILEDLHTYKHKTTKNKKDSSRIALKRKQCARFKESITIFNFYNNTKVGKSQEKKIR